MTDEQRKQIEQKADESACITYCANEQYERLLYRRAFIWGAEFGLSLSADRVKELEIILKEIIMINKIMSISYGSAWNEIINKAEKLLKQSDNEDNNTRG